MFNHLTHRTSLDVFVQDRFCGRWRLQPFSSDGHPVFSRFDKSEKGATGRPAGRAEGRRVGKEELRMEDWGRGMGKATKV